MPVLKNKRLNNVFKLSALSYFKEDDGCCYFSKKNFMETFETNKKDNISNDLIALKELGLIDNLTINGYYNKIKILDDNIKCYDFILNKNLTDNQRGFLYEIKDLDLPEDKKKYPIKYITRKISLDEGSVESYLSNIRSKINVEEAVLNKQEVHGHIYSNFGELIKDENGYRLSTKNKKICKYCGEEDQNKFFYLHKNICINCIGTYSIAREESYVDLLYRKSRSSIKNRKYDYTLTKEYIKEILESQGGKCAYSGLEFDISEKASSPTIDRIDSNKGYEIGNIAIVRCDINLMKSNMTLDKFFYLIDNICKYRECGCNE